MRKTIFLMAVGLMAFASSAVMAADLSFQSPASATVDEASASFSGFYVGGAAGYGWAEADSEHMNVNPFGGPGGLYDGEGEDFVFSGFAGIQQQFGSFILGLEAGARNGIDAERDYSIYDNYTATTNDWIVTAKGRLGVAFGPIAIYVNGGYAGGDVGVEQDYDPAGPVQVTYGAEEWHHGYTAGADAEFLVTENLFLRGSYSYTDLGDLEHSGTASNGAVTDIKTDLQDHTVSVGLGLKF